MTNPIAEIDRLLSHSWQAEQDLRDITAACFAATSELFPLLSIRDIIAPPHEWFDAALARQIAYHMMVRQFHVPKRRVCEEFGRAREAVNRGLRMIDERLSEPAFSAGYHGAADRARALVLTDRIERAA
jgi:hypothetical protein